MPSSKGQMGAICFSKDITGTSVLWRPSASGGFAIALLDFDQPLLAP